MVLHGRVELLAHPLSQKYLQMKWNSYGKYFHLANLLFYSIYLFCVTLFSQQLMYAKSVNTTQSNDTEERSTTYGYMTTTLSRSLRNPTLNSSAEFPIPPPPTASYIHVSMPMLICGLGILGYVFLNGLKELLQAYQQKWHYLFEPVNLLSWLLHIAAVIMVMPMCNGCAQGIHYSAASITIFVSWFNLLLLLRRFDQIGIYVVMFLEILQTLIKVLAVFSILIIAFGLGFFILLSKVSVQAQSPGTYRKGSLDKEDFIFQISNPHVNPNHLSFATVPMSLLRTFSMMLGEVDFVGTYVQPYYLGELPFPFPSFALLCKCSILKAEHFPSSQNTFQSHSFRSLHDPDAYFVNESLDRSRGWRH